MQISIIVPAYNSADYLPLCVESLQAQISLDYEILLVNDGSTDRTADVCNFYAEKDSRIRVFHQSNKGLSEARNLGLKKAIGEYVLFVDSDDWIAKDACCLLYQRAIETNADIVLSTMSYWDNDNTSYKVGEKHELFSDKEVMNGGDSLYKMLRTDCYTPMVCGNLYRKQYLDSYHLSFTGRVHEDERFSPIAFYYAERVTYLSDDVYFYRQHENSIMHSYQLSERMKALYDISVSLYNFVTAQIEEEGIHEHQNALCSLLWQSGSLYLRALKLNESIVRKGGEESLSWWQVANICQYKDMFTRDNREWLDEIELLLLEKQKKISFLNHCSKDRKQLFIFSRESIGNKYGIGTYIRQLVQCFEVKKWMVCVVSLYTNEKENSLEEKEGILYFTIPYPSVNVVTTGPSSMESRYYKNVFYFLASHVRYREVYCHFNFVHVYELAMLFKQKLNSINLFTLHYMGWSFDLLGDKEHLERALLDVSDENSKYLKMEFEREQRFMAECCDKVVTIARHSYETVHTLYKISVSKLELIPNALQDEYIERTPQEIKRLREKYGFDDNDKLLVFAGRLDPVKGVLELIEAFNLLQQEISGVRLVIAGDGNFKSCFEVANPSWSKIVFTGFIPKEQLFELYAIADVGIAPSLHEEFGYVAIEMMMNKLPVIASANTGLKEIMDNGKYGALVDMSGADKVLKLKKAMVDWLGNVEKNKIYKELGRQRFMQEYSKSTFIDRIKLLYHNDICYSINN